jgi:hypothetical protein
LFISFEDNFFILYLGSATPKSPTVRSPTMSSSPLGSAQNSDAENDVRIPGKLETILFYFSLIIYSF